MYQHFCDFTKFVKVLTSEAYKWNYVYVFLTFLNCFNTIRVAYEETIFNFHFFCKEKNIFIQIIKIIIIYSKLLNS